MLGAQPQDEDFPPIDPDDLDPNNFDFHGYGQPGQGPPNPPPRPPNNFNGNATNFQAIGWAPWPASQMGPELEQQLLQIVHANNAQQ